MVGLGKLVAGYVIGGGGNYLLLGGDVKGKEQKSSE